MKIDRIEKIAMQSALVALQAIVPMTMGATSLPGNYSIVASGNEAGGLYVSDYLSAGGEIYTHVGVSMGETHYYSANPMAYLRIYTVEDENDGGVFFSANEPEARFVWADDGEVEFRRKMELDGDNKLSLFDNGGVRTIALSGMGGRVTLNGEGSGLYSGTTPLLTLNSGGDAVFGSGMIQHFANTTASNSSVTGALTVAGGIGVGKDSYFNGVRVGRGGGNQSSNTALGAEGLGANSGGANTAVGYSSLRSNQAASWNTAVSFNSLYYNTVGEANTAVGAQALFSNTTGVWNSGLGGAVLYNNTTGVSNTAMGSEALFQATTASYNTAVGRSALHNQTTGGGDTAVGTAALQESVAATDNTAVGSFAMLQNVDGGANVMLGSHAGYNLVAGGQNIMIGHKAGTARADGVSALTGVGKSIYIGTDARGYSNGDENAIVIGHEAISEGANTTVIGNTATTRTKINGSVETPKVTATSTTGNALVVEGGTLLNGQVVLGQAQGDISMGIYQ